MQGKSDQRGCEAQHAATLTSGAHGFVVRRLVAGDGLDFLDQHRHHLVVRDVGFRMPGDEVLGFGIEVDGLFRLGGAVDAIGDVDGK